MVWAVGIVCCRHTITSYVFDRSRSFAAAFRSTAKAPKPMFRTYCMARKPPPAVTSASVPVSMSAT